MSKEVYIKLTRVNPSMNEFDIYDQANNVIDTNVSREQLIEGVGYTVSDSVIMIRIVADEPCHFEKAVFITPMSKAEFFSIVTEVSSTGCMWRHLTNPSIYNYFYGGTEPYVIEYPFAYDYYDQILRNVKDYTSSYTYISDGEGLLSRTNRVELDNEWFNKAIVYNGQQCSGLLELVPKPRRNLRDYLYYPVNNAESKTIVFTKSDNFYQYNMFWSIVKDKSQPMFVKSCESLSIDKELNQANMNYGDSSFRKAPLRAKDVKVRHILDNKSNIHLVSKFIYAPTQISYK